MWHFIPGMQDTRGIQRMRKEHKTRNELSSKSANAGFQWNEVKTVFSLSGLCSSPHSNGKRFPHAFLQVMVVHSPWKGGRWFSDYGLAPWSSFVVASIWILTPGPLSASSTFTIKVWSSCLELQRYSSRSNPIFLQLYCSPLPLNLSPEDGGGSVLGLPPSSTPHILAQSLHPAQCLDY